MTLSSFLGLSSYVLIKRMSENYAKRRYLKETICIVKVTTSVH